MRVLSSIDFSESSVNACKWVYKMLSETENPSIHLVHCISLRSRGDVFINIYDRLKFRAIEDIEHLIEKLKKISEDIEITYEIVLADPKEYLASIAKMKDFDLIVTGTKGLSTLKDLTVGSVTEYLMNHSSTPLLAIPHKASYSGIGHLVVGVDDLNIDLEKYDFLSDVARDFDSKIHMVHVTAKKELVTVSDSKRDREKDSKRFSVHIIEKDDNVAESLEDFADDIDAHMICLLHDKKNWFSGLFHRSVVKAELFEIETPLLVLRKK